ncbi:MAG: tRNA 2-thiouridine(34) synthase MnmA [Gammaproteobacteria bacterium]
MYTNFDKSLAEIRSRYNDPHIVVAISGGVDSAVTAMLLKQAGVRLTAIFMKNWDEPDEYGNCQWEEDVRDALDVCEKLDIPINTVDLSQAYWDDVFADFLREYRLGRTPNPDILCNREVKFKAFLNHIDELEGDIIATGHYSQIGYETHSGKTTYQLLRGLDANKDQSYFLYTLGQTQLQRSMFPIGSLEKTEVRRLAKAAGLAVHTKKDSTGICFIGERKFREFLSDYISIKPGPIKTIEGQTIGQHEGTAFYTIGQREGLGIGGVKGYPQGPWFVAEKDPANNELLVTQGHNHPALMSSRLIGDNPHWISGIAPQFPLKCTAQTRYRQKDETCTVTLGGEASVEVDFEQAQRAVTPGQSVVFYDGPVCLGGAIIASAEKPQA